MGPVLMLPLVTAPAFIDATDEVVFDYWTTGHDAQWAQQIPGFEQSYLGATVARLA